MGSKNIKGIVAHGKKLKHEAADPEMLQKQKERGRKYINRNVISSEERATARTEQYPWIKCLSGITGLKDTTKMASLKKHSLRSLN